MSRKALLFYVMAAFSAKSPDRPKSSMFSITACGTETWRARARPISRSCQKFVRHSKTLYTYHYAKAFAICQGHFTAPESCTYSYHLGWHGSRCIIGFWLSYNIQLSLGLKQATFFTVILMLKLFQLNSKPNPKKL